MSYLAEQNVIGSLLMDNDCMKEIYGLLTPEMFTQPVLGSVFREFQRGYDKRYSVNLAVLEQNLRSDSMPSAILLDEIRQCITATQTSATVRAYARVIENDYKSTVWKVGFVITEYRPLC